MRLYLINPCNPLVSLANARRADGTDTASGSPWACWSWRPDAAGVGGHHHRREPGRAGLSAMPRPDLVGITAFTSQASRAYEVAAEFRSRGVPVVMGGIHATMCRAGGPAPCRRRGHRRGRERLGHGAGRCAAGPACNGSTRGGHADMARSPPARHDLLQRRAMPSAPSRPREAAR